MKGSWSTVRTEFSPLQKKVCPGCLSQLQPFGLDWTEYRGYSKLRTRTALASYGRAMLRRVGPPQGRCVSMFTHTGVSHS